MQNRNRSYNLYRNEYAGEEQSLQKGQKVNYEGKAAYVISLKPVVIIKTKNSIVCGALYEQLSK